MGAVTDLKREVGDIYKTLRTGVTDYGYIIEKLNGAVFKIDAEIKDGLSKIKSEVYFRDEVSLFKSIDKNYEAQLLITQTEIKEGIANLPNFNKELEDLLEERKEYKSSLLSINNSIYNLELIIKVDAEKIGDYQSSLDIAGSSFKKASSFMSNYKIDKISFVDFGITEENSKVFFEDFKKSNSSVFTDIKYMFGVVTKGMLSSDCRNFFSKLELSFRVSIDVIYTGYVSQLKITEGYQLESEKIENFLSVLENKALNDNGLWHELKSNRKDCEKSLRYMDSKGVELESDILFYNSAVLDIDKTVKDIVNKKTVDLLTADNLESYKIPSLDLLFNKVIDSNKMRVDILNEIESLKLKSELLNKSLRGMVEGKEKVDKLKDYSKVNYSISKKVDISKISLDGYNLKKSIRSDLEKSNKRALVASNDSLSFVNYMLFSNMFFGYSNPVMANGDNVDGMNSIRANDSVGVGSDLNSIADTLTDSGVDSGLFNTIDSIGSGLDSSLFDTINSIDSSLSDIGSGVDSSSNSCSSSSPSCSSSSSSCSSCSS